MPVFIVIVAAVTALLASRRRRRRSDRLPAVAEIVSPPKATVIARDGAVSSVQSAELTLAYDDWKRMWNATHLENLARTYWRFLSRVTGWTIRETVSDPDHGGEFVFLRRAHEPGSHTVIGREYTDIGLDQGRAVLTDLARHPATARHLATKLARHFVADEPPPALVDRLAARFIDTDGDLKEVTRALVSAPEAWEPKQAKIKRPAEWIVAALRATGQKGNTPRIVGGLTLLGEPLWRPPAPKGFPDDNAAWHDGLAQRLDIANAFAQRVAEQLDPKAIAETAIGPLASTEAREVIDRAESKPQALALLLMTPEFLRR